MVAQGITPCCLDNLIVDSSERVAAFNIDISICIIATYLICDFIYRHSIFPFVSAVADQALYIPLTLSKEPA